MGLHSGGNLLKKRDEPTPLPEDIREAGRRGGTQKSCPGWGSKRAPGKKEGHSWGGSGSPLKAGTSFSGSKRGEGGGSVLISNVGPERLKDPGHIRRKGSQNWEEKIFNKLLPWLRFPGERGVRNPSAFQEVIGKSEFFVETLRKPRFRKRVGGMAGLKFVKGSRKKKSRNRGDSPGSRPEDRMCLSWSRGKPRGSLGKRKLLQEGEIGRGKGDKGKKGNRGLSLEGSGKKSVVKGEGRAGGKSRANGTTGSRGGTVRGIRNDRKMRERTSVPRKLAARSPYLT